MGNLIAEPPTSNLNQSFLSKLSERTPDISPWICTLAYQDNSEVHLIVSGSRDRLTDIRNQSFMKDAVFLIMKNAVVLIVGILLGMVVASFYPPEPIQRPAQEPRQPGNDALVSIVTGDSRSVGANLRGGVGQCLSSS
jgi:hypothetical protein